MGEFLRSDSSVKRKTTKELAAELERLRSALDKGNMRGAILGEMNRVASQLNSRRGSSRFSVRGVA